MLATYGINRKKLLNDMLITLMKTKQTIHIQTSSHTERLARGNNKRHSRSIVMNFKWFANVSI